MDKKGTSGTADTKLNTVHQNQISGIQIQVGDKNSAKVVSTIASDGMLVSWDLANLEKLMNGLKIWFKKPTFNLILFQYYQIISLFFYSKMVEIIGFMNLISEKQFQRTR